MYLINKLLSYLKTESKEEFFFFQMKEYVGIYIKTEKAQEQDGFGNKMKYHFHITTLHKYI